MNAHHRDETAPLSQAVRLEIEGLRRKEGWLKTAAIINFGGINEQVQLDVIAGRALSPDDRFKIEAGIAEYEGRSAPPPPTETTQPGSQDKPTPVAPAKSHTRASPGQIVQRAIEYKALSVDVNARTVRVVCSTDMVDAYGDSVEQSWNLARFNANPVLLYAHNARELPLGNCSETGVSKLADGRMALVSTMHFASAKANPLAENVFQLFVEGVLRSVSVGFIPRTVREEMRGGKSVTVLADNELFELSVTPTPANPEALVRSKSASPSPSPAPTKAAPRMSDDDMRKLAWMLEPDLLEEMNKRADEILAEESFSQNADDDFAVAMAGAEAAGRESMRRALERYDDVPAAAPVTADATRGSLAVAGLQRAAEGQGFLDEVHRRAHRKLAAGEVY